MGKCSLVEEVEPRIWETLGFHSAVPWKICNWLIKKKFKGVFLANRLKCSYWLLVSDCVEGSNSDSISVICVCTFHMICLMDSAAGRLFGTVKQTAFVLCLCIYGTHLHLAVSLRQWHQQPPTSVPITMGLLQMDLFHVKWVTKAVFNGIDRRQQPHLKAYPNGDNLISHVTYTQPGL